MELSKRLEVIASHVDKCESIADIGTDHGYIPIDLVKRGICERAVASDINKGPMEKARINVGFEGLSDKIKVYLGAGLKPLKVSEVDGIIIAGMGGNLTRNIILWFYNQHKILKFLENFYIIIVMKLLMKTLLKRMESFMNYLKLNIVEVLSLIMEA